MLIKAHSFNENNWNSFCSGQIIKQLKIIIIFIPFLEHIQIALIKLVVFLSVWQSISANFLLNIGIGIKFE